LEHNVVGNCSWY